MVTRRELYGFVRRELLSDFEARQLCFYVLGNLDGEASDEDKKRLEELTEKRKSGYPLQYIIGEWDFYGRTFKVGEGVLIPRQDTETLVDAAKEIQCEKNVVIDLCSGTGCIGITLEKELGAKVYAVEKSVAAANFLKENITLNSSAMTLVMGDALDNETASRLPEADIIVCNPPYLTSEDMNMLQKEVSYEPESALFGGKDGLDFYRGITTLWKNKLKSGGYFIYEIGMGQHTDVAEILVSNDFENITYKYDLCKIIRAVIARKK